MSLLLGKLLVLLLLLLPMLLDDGVVPADAGDLPIMLVSITAVLSLCQS